MDSDTKRAILLLGLESGKIFSCIKARDKPDDETLIAFVEQSLDAEQFEQTKRHIADCHNCYARYSEIRLLLRDPDLIVEKPKITTTPGQQSASAGLLTRLREAWPCQGYALATALATAFVVAIVVTTLNISRPGNFETSIASFSGAPLNWLASNDQVIKSFNPVFSLNTGPINNVNAGIKKALSLVNLTAPVALPDALTACQADTTAQTCSANQSQAYNFGLWLTLTGFLCQDNNEATIQQHLGDLPDLQNSDLSFISDELNTSSATSLCGSAEMLFNTLIDR